VAVGSAGSLVIFLEPYEREREREKDTEKEREREREREREKKSGMSILYVL
jgi:hypothetical protein